jgi:hypothetical protein
MECPIHAKSKPKFTKAYSFGLVTGLFFSIVMGRTIRLPMISERNEATQRAERFTRSDFLPALLFLHLRALAVRVLQLISRAGIWQCSTFEAPLSPGKRRADVKPTRLLSERRIDQPVRLSGGRRSPGLRPKQPNQRSAPDRAASAARWSRLAPNTTSLSGPPVCVCIMRRTSHSTARKRAKGRNSE